MNHWVVHWFLIDRDGIALTDIEQFHLKVFSKYHDFIMANIDKITISFAKTSKTSPELISLIERTLSFLFSGKKIEFQIRDNNQKVGEFETFRDNVLCNIGSNEKILYTHIKGVYRINAVPMILKKELIWIWNMYKVVFSSQSLESLDEFIMAGPDFSIYDTAFNTIKTKRWNPIAHIYKTYIKPLTINLEKDNSNDLIKRFIELLPNDANNKLPWAYLGTFYWINASTLESYLNSIGFSKEDIVSIAGEFQKYDRPSTLNNATTNLNGNVVKMTFANNVSEYFLPSIVEMKRCSFFKFKD